MKLRKQNRIQNNVSSGENNIKIELVKKCLGKGQSVMVRGVGLFKTGFNDDLDNSMVITGEKIISKENGSVDFKKLGKLIRRSVLVKFKDTLRIVEGQITGITDYTIQLKTTDMESQFEIGNEFLNELNRERVIVGDIIRFYKDFGIVKKLGRGVSLEENTPDTEVVEIPSNECLKNERMTTTLTLDEIDIINSEVLGPDYIHANVNVCDNIKSEVDRKIVNWLEQRQVERKRKMIIFENLPFSLIKQVDSFLKNNNSCGVYLVNEQISIDGIIFIELIEDDKTLILEEVFKNNNISQTSINFINQLLPKIDFNILLNLIDLTIDDKGFKEKTFKEFLDLLVFNEN
ncbi:RUVB2 [Hepatospora eriocheir]|uniref:RuvB-like helicase n=1 Tax=Hepatospora eriocheir TaxID=1081669 RepID=A0A1X0QFI9_9MICR|nr:RUVB2 [Hepatospora eriocheir]